MVLVDLRRNQLHVVCVKGQREDNVCHSLVGCLSAVLFSVLVFILVLFSLLAVSRPAQTLRAHVTRAGEVADRAIEESVRNPTGAPAIEEALEGIAE
eukprot:3158975-Rhodomonas_salina.1